VADGWAGISALAAGVTKHMRRLSAATATRKVGENMSDGTILNGVYAIRMHKDNAVEVRDNAEDMLRYYRDKLLILAAQTPPATVDTGDGPIEWGDYIRMEIEGMWAEITESVISAWMASYIIACPDDCKDEYVETDWVPDSPKDDVSAGGESGEKGKPEDRHEG